MTQLAALDQHPVLSCAARVRQAVKDVADTNAVFMDRREKERALRELAAARTELEAVWLKVVAVADDVASHAGARDIGAWLRAELKIDGGRARADARLADDLDHRWSGLARALQDGAVSTAHARVIARVLDELPDIATADDVTEAERLMIKLAATLTPTELRKAGRRILELVDPDRFDEAEARALLRAEEEAEKRTSLGFADRGDGTVALRGVLPARHALRLKTYLEAFAQPRKARLERSGKKAPYDRLLGQAFCELLERYDADRLPHHGGDATTVFVTITLDDLTRRLGSGHLGFEGDAISAGEARRLACQARVIPVVLGTDSEILDVGRSSRLHTPVQRKVIRLRDRCCRAEGCDIPAAWCDVHHLKPWSQGGRTSVDDGVLLCGHHHRLAHHPGYDNSRLASGDLRFHRRR